MSDRAREADRVESLRTYALSPTREQAFDDIARLAAAVCQAPVGLVNVVDADLVWSKGSWGSPGFHLPRPADAFCEWLVEAGADALVIDDTHADAIWSANPHVTSEDGIAAYAGVPLVGRDGLALGTVCVVDTVARPFTDQQVSDLLALAAQAATLLELRRADLRHHGLADAAPAPSDVRDPRALRQALERREFVPFLQPIVSVTSGAPVGFEALARWKHPTRGLVPPADFLPAIESSGLMLPVGRHILEQALDHLVALREAFVIGGDLTVGVNVSPVQLSVPGLSDFVADELAARGLPPTALTVELTESMDLIDSNVARRELHALRELGVDVAIDDYGTGHSGLMRVLDLPVSTLKLDRSLTSRLAGDPRVLAAARSVIAMAEDLGLTVIAEGVETAEQHAVLADIGCPLAQGYLFSRPLAPELVADFVRPWEVRPALTVVDSGSDDEDRSGAVAQPAPSQKLPSLVSSHDAVLHRSDGELTDAVVDFLTRDLACTESMVVIATHAHRRRFESALTRRGHDVVAWRAARRYLAYDADELLGMLLSDGQVDRTLFRAAVEPLLSGARGPVRIYGEMVAQLCRAGRPDAALQLEDLWCELRREQPFQLLCGYPLAVVAGDDRGAFLDRVLNRHGIREVGGAA